MLPTKQFKADFDLEDETYLRKGPKRMTPPRRQRTIFPCGKLSLERQPCGTEIDFDIYDDADLPFLDKSTEVGRMVSKNIV